MLKHSDSFILEGNKMTEELFKYLNLCVNFYHKNDESFKITDESRLKENLRYLETIHYLNELYKGNNEPEQNCNTFLKKPTFRPFKSCNELIYRWELEKFGCSANPLQMFDIWVKLRIGGRRRMIVGFGDDFVEVGVKAKPITLKQLFEMYTFLDGSPCGVEE